MYIPAEEIEPPECIAKGGASCITHLFHTHSAIEHLLSGLLETAIAIHHLFLIERHVGNIHFTPFQIAIEECCLLIVDRHFFFFMQSGIVEEARPEEVDVLLNQ